MSTVRDSVSRAGAAARRVAGRLGSYAAHRYVVGPDVADAVRVAAELARDDLRCTFAYWDDPQDTPEAVLEQYLLATAALPPDSYLSVKLTALGFSADLFDRLLRDAGPELRVHVDAMQPETVDRTLAVVRGARPGSCIGVTLPGRWRRSVEDAVVVSELGLPVRVVKGQWADPDDPDLDLRLGFLDTVDALAGRAGPVGIATHDVPLMAEAARRLRSAGTSCDVELLYGLPMRASLMQAARLGLRVRVYLPYGRAYLPYALSQLRRNPRLLAHLAKDVLGRTIETVRPRRP